KRVHIPKRETADDQCKRSQQIHKRVGTHKNRPADVCTDHEKRAMREVEHIQQTEDERETRGNKKSDRTNGKTAQECDDEILLAHPLRGGGEECDKYRKQNEQNVIF